MVGWSLCSCCNFFCHLFLVVSQCDLLHIVLLSIPSSQIFQNKLWSMSINKCVPLPLLSGPDALPDWSQPLFLLLMVCHTWFAALPWPRGSCSAGTGLLRTSSECYANLSRCASWVESTWPPLSVIVLLLRECVPDSFLVMLCNSFMFLLLFLLMLLSSSLRHLLSSVWAKASVAFVLELISVSLSSLLS